MTPPPQDELTNTVFDALQSLSPQLKANFLLDSALKKIDAGQYGQEVENYLEVYLRTPGLPKEDIARALLARGKARKLGGERLLAKAEQDFQAVVKLDPTNREIQHYVRREKVIHFTSSPASQRAPPEIWERIALHIPRFHLRTWLFVSSFHRDIAVRHIFHTVDIYFGEDQENLNRGLDIFDRAKADPVFASRVKSLRLHWAYEEGDMLDLMTRIFRTALPEFRALRDFEWIGYPEMRADMVQAVLASHPHLHGLGLIGWHFDAVGVSAFTNLRKFTLRAEDDDGFADMGEVRTVLDNNAKTLKHLVLGAYLARHHSWDSAFQSVTIKNLTHLDLVDTRISHIVLARIAHAHCLQSLTLHGTFEEPSSASVVFGSDHIIDGTHTFLPHLEAFRFVLVGHDDELPLYHSIISFLRKRTKLRRLDLGGCPWDLVKSVLPDLKSLRVLGVRIKKLTREAVDELVSCLPRQMSALSLGCVVEDASLDTYAPHLRPLPLSFIHLHTASKRRPKPNLMSEKDFQLQTDIWMSAARNVALALPSVDFVGWHGEHYVVVRSGVNFPAPLPSPVPSASSSSSSAFGGGGGREREGEAQEFGYRASPYAVYDAPWNMHAVELKELPSRRRLDCGKGVDLGSEDAAWLERKDVPMDYEMPGLE